jgi:hypothetical protein
MHHFLRLAHCIGASPSVLCPDFVNEIGDCSVRRFDAEPDDGVFVIQVFRRDLCGCYICGGLRGIEDSIFRNRNVDLLKDCLEARRAGLKVQFLWSLPEQLGE